MSGSEFLSLDLLDTSEESEHDEESRTLLDTFDDKEDASEDESDIKDDSDSEAKEAAPKKKKIDTSDNLEQAAGTSDKDHQGDSSPSRTLREKRSGSIDCSRVNLKMQKIQSNKQRVLSVRSLDSFRLETGSDAHKANNNTAMKHLKVQIPSIEQDQNDDSMDEAKAPIRIPSDELNKLKMEAKDHEQLKLEHNALEEQHNNLLKQHKSLLNHLKRKTKVTETEHEQLKQKHNTFIEQLKSKVECPVCYEVPKRTPIPVCPNGHIVCQSCKQETCPMCREPMEEARSLVAATVVENFLHNCDYITYGCNVVQIKHSDIVEHLDACPYRFHGNAWRKLSETTGIKLKGSFVDLGVKFSPVTSFYDFEEMDTARKKVMWPPNAVQFDGTIFFLYVINDPGYGIWRFIVEWGDGNPERGDELRTKYMASIEVFKPGDNSGCRRHFHMHRSVGRFDNNQQHVLTLDNSQMQGLFLEKKFAISVEIGFVRDLIGKIGVSYDLSRKYLWTPNICGHREGRT